MSYVLCLLTFLFASFASGQPPDSQIGNLSITGQVLNEVSGEPVPRVLIELGHLRRSTITDSSGMFRFDGLAVGADVIFNIVRPDFRARNQSPEGRLEKSIADYKIRIYPLSAIFGQVFDNDGSPIPFANVDALQMKIVSGRRFVQRVRNVRADDQGRYRMWGFEPGKFYLFCTGKLGGLRTFVGSTPPMTDDTEAFIPTYYGGQMDLASATPIELKDGANFEANFRLPMHQASQISGRVLNFKSAPPPTIKLFRGSTDGDGGLAHRVVMNSVTGVFVISDVVPGQYRLVVRQESREAPFLAEATVNVGTKPLEGLTLSLAQRPALAVRVKTEDGLPIDGNSNRVALALHRNGRNVVSRNLYFDRGESKGEIQTQFESVEPGVYEVEVETRGTTTVGSIRFGGADLLESRRLEIPPGVGSLPPLEIGLTKRGFQLTLEFHPDIARKAGAVLLVPQFPASFGVLVSTDFLAPESRLVPRSPDNGKGVDRKAHFDGLPAGDYLAYAFTTLDNIEFNEPSWRSSLRGGVRVTLSGIPGTAVKLIEELTQ